ncbi:MAG: amidase [Chloroflexota bacterium]|nr:MAG: amidase [Chloroflexota bacterium]
MPTSDLIYTPATELRRLLNERRVSAVELLDAVLARIDAIESRVGIFQTLDADGARTAALAADAAIQRGDSLGPLHGLPITIKDLEPTAGLRTTYGSRFFVDYVPAEDGAVAARVRGAGAIILGKSNTSHFGHKDMCDNLIGPPTRNPWNLSRTSGASSGGAGAAAASGVGPIAHGTDGAGSIRIPASLCGVFGFKPSFGLISTWPNTDFWAARTHAGPLARTVRDAAMFLNATAGPDRRDPLTFDSGTDDWIRVCDGGIRGLRVAWSATFGYAPLDPTVRAVVERAVGHFTDLGCTVEAVDPGWDDPAPFARVLWHASMAYRHGQRYRQQPEWFEPSMAEMVEDGLKLSAVDVGEAMMARSAFYERARTFLARYDLLLTPQMPTVAWDVDGYPTVEGRDLTAIFDRVPFTFPFNLTGWPAASVPCGFVDGLPVGLQIVAPWRQDALCLRAAAAFEVSHPWAAARPPLN